MLQLTRRAWLAAAASGAATACAHPALRTGDPLARLDATATAAAVRSGEITAVQAVEAAIARSERLEPQLNFLVIDLYARARAAAAAGPSGPFAGVPFLIKDLDDVAGVPTSWGSRLSEGRPAPKVSDPHVAAMEAAGLVAIGKSTTPEYGLLATTEPLAGGPTGNPWDPTRSSGGSSGGSAAAVAAGVVPIAHASDGGGSIRIPAANCGVFGLKPSRGRMIGNRNGPLDIAVDGCVSRTVRDSAAFYAAFEKTGADATLTPIGLVTGPRKRKLRIGVLEGDAMDRAPDPEVVAGVRAAADLCRSLGHAVEPAAWPVDGRQFADDFLDLWATGAGGIVRGARRGLGRDPTEQELEPFTFALARRAAAIKPAEAEETGKRLVAAGIGYEAQFTVYDVILSPVLGTPPPELGWFGPTTPYETLVERLVQVVGYTPINNVSGGPAMSVPLHWTRGGLPVGMHFAARIGDERTLLELAYQLEAAKPWAGRRPPISA